MKKNTNFLYIKPLYYLCNVLAITPPHTFGQDVTPPSWTYKFYTLIHVVVIFIFFVHSNRGRQTNYDILEPTVAITDQVANISMTLFNILLRILTVFYNGKNIKLFINSAYHLSLRIEFSCFTPEHFWAQLIGFHLYMTFILGLDAWVWLTTVGIKHFQFYIGRIIIYYICNLSFFLMLHFALIIKHHFRSLNHLLEITTKALLWDESSNVHYLVLSDFKIPTLPTNIFYQYDDLRKIGQCYNVLCELVDIYNKLFGFVILIAIFVVITFILNMVDLFLVYAIQQKKNIQGVQFGPELTTVCILWILTFLVRVLSILLASACDGAVAESKRISTICFGWINEIPTSTKSYKCQIIKEELLLLAQHTTSQKPAFSAAGFFNVDFTLLGFVVGSVTSYIIVILQFIK